jgi:GTPase SAR1 family protein
VIIVYDITKQDSFLHVENWLNEIKNTAKNECCICVVGNKSDLREQRVIKYNEAANFCQKNSKVQCLIQMFLISNAQL